jgi:pimeloyl-ACP methyl ester carboxylesterase
MILIDSADISTCTCLRSYRVAALDMRHHGDTVEDHPDDDNLDFSKDKLSDDVVALWQAVFGEEKPPTVLVGHSVGGAIAVWTAQKGSIPSLEGLIVIDVVEGTAIGAHIVLCSAQCLAFYAVHGFVCPRYDARMEFSSSLQRHCRAWWEY